MAKQPDSIGKYQVIRQIAQGGMGSVYVAAHPTLDRSVIIKKLTLRGNADIRERFRREAQIMMDLRNDAIVDVYDHFREGTSYYIVLEYVDGMSLEELIRRRRYLPNHIALLVFREVCRALAYAHSRGVVHRDIKPANILISHRGDVKLVDFGIATIHGDEQSDLTREGMTLGTPSYMAPEQFQNTRNVDYRADVYSLGVVLYEMVTGKRPYPGSFTPDVLARIQKGRYDAPRRVNPKVHLFTAQLISAMLRPKPARRPSDLGKLIQRIDRRLRLKPHAPSRATVEKYLGGDEHADMPRRPRRARIVVATIALMAVGAGVGAIYVSGLYNEVILPDRSAALEVSVRIPRSIAPTERVSVAGVVALQAPAGDDVNSRPITLRFMRDHAEDSVRFVAYRSQRVYSAPGTYRLDVEDESTLWSQLLELRSLRDEHGDGFIVPGTPSAARIVRVELPDPPRAAVDVVFRATDRGTLREIPGARLSVYVDGVWRAWGAFSSAIVRSGGTYRFRFDHPLYRSESIDVTVRPYQNRVFLDATMTRR